MSNRGTRGAFLVGKLQIANGVQFLSGAGAPTDGTAGTGAGQAGPGSFYVDITNKAHYRNTGTKASPVWNAIAGTAAITREEIGLPVINKSGSSIAADKLVAISGLDATSGKPKIVLADADVAAHDDVWVTTAAIANNAEGTVVSGALSAANLNTNSASAAGDPVYLDVTAGGFTHTAPTGATARVKPVGFVVVKSATVGQILWSIGPVRGVGTNELQAAAVTKTKLAGGFSKVTVVAGQDETGDATIPVTGMAAGDELVAVLVFASAASIATMAQRANADFTVGADNLTVVANAANNAANQYLIIWNDLT